MLKLLVDNERTDKTPNNTNRFDDIIFLYMIEGRVRPREP